MLKRRIMALLLAGVLAATNTNGITAYASSTEAATLMVADETDESVTVSESTEDEKTEENASEDASVKTEVTVEEKESSEEEIKEDTEASEDSEKEDAESEETVSEDEDEDKEDAESEEDEDKEKADSEKAESDLKTKEDGTKASKDSKEKSSKLMDVTRTINSVHSGDEVSRIEWLRQLIATFELSVGEDDYPDNYYADIDSSYEYYHEAMIATEFGLVDVYPGEDFNPDAVATRDFAAHSLNMCLGYILETDDYTYSDSGSAAYPEDDQIAVDQGWFTLISGKFMPGEAVLSGEANAILDFVKETLAEDKSTGTGEYEYKSDVKLLPEGTEITTPDSGVLLLVGYASNGIGLKSGDIFGIVYDGMPLAWRAESVSTSGSDLKVTVSTVDMDEAFESIDIGVTNEADIKDMQTVSDTAELFYVVGGSEENNYRDGQLFSSVEELGGQEPDALLIEDEVDVSSLTSSINVADGVKLNYSVSIKNFKYDWSANRTKSHFNADFDVNIQASLSEDLLKMAGVDIPVCKLALAPGILYEIGVRMKLEGKVSVVYVENIKAGVSWEKNRGVRFTKSFKKKSFTVTTEIEGQFGVYAEIKAVYLIMEAALYAELGFKGSYLKAEYRDGKNPYQCKNIHLWLYAEIGYYIKVLDGKLCSESNRFVYYNEKNSPIKICAHYEDGRQVTSCTRAEDFKTVTGSYPGYKGGIGQNWYSPKNTQYYYNGSSSMVEDYAIFDYELNDDDEATITKYNGNMRNLMIPAELDGYKVVGIGDGVFKNNTRINYVSIPEGVKTIGIDAFRNCTNLSTVILPETLTSLERYAFSECPSLEEVTLPHNLTSLGAHAFDGCSSLTSINIPKTLTEMGSYWGYYYFANTGLKEVEFAEGIDKIPYFLFDNCESLESIEIPSTVTEIQDGAFNGAKGLKTIKLSDKLTKIGIDAFRYCESLEEITIPETVVSIERYAFAECTKLAKANLPHNLTYLGAHVFDGCSSLTSINIPKTLTEMGKFYGHNHFANSGLKEVVFDEGIEKIPYFFFDNCESLESIEIPSTVTEIQEGAFNGAKGLKSVKLSDKLTTIGIDAFRYCESLEEITIPETVVSIERYAFAECRKLAKANLPHNLTYLGAHIFDGCSSLTSINIPKTLTNMGKYYSYKYFANSGLKEVVFDEGITKIPTGLFEDCDSLESIEIPATVTEICNEAFQGIDGIKSFVMPDSVITIGDNAFNEAKGLTTIKLSNKLTTIGVQAFLNCENLEEITLPDSVTSIDRLAFNGCRKLKTATLSKNMTSIGASAFGDCSSLEEITIPASVKYFGSYNTYSCFAGCTSLKKVVYEGELTKIQTDMFSGDTALTTIVFPKGLTEIWDGAFENCDSLTTLTIPDTVVKIGTVCFKDCDGLTEVVISDRVKTFGNYCFESCEKLKTFKLGTGATVIPEGMFYKCPALESIILPYGITSIDKNAFVDCTGFTSITIPKTVTTINDAAFSYLSTLTVYGVAESYAETWAKSKGAKFVAINKHAEKIDLNKTELSLANGASERLTFKVTPEDFTDDVEWKSTNKNIVTVAEDGTVKAVGIGEANIKLYVGDDASATCRVTVVQPVTYINIDKSSVDLEAYETVQLKATVSPDNAYDRTFTWSTSDESIAIIDENGLVTAVAKGEATITATANDGSGIHDTCLIRVTRDVINCKAWTELESEHNYASNSDLLWRYQQPGANKLTLTFDEKTSLEEGGDYLYIYTGNKTLVGEYTGTELAGKKVDVIGDTVRIQLKSDKTHNEWGFKVTNVTSDEETYTLSFDSNGHGTAPSSLSEVSSIPSSLEQLSATGYTFGGWYLSKDCKDIDKAVAGTKLTKDTTLFAKWTAYTYTLTLNPGTGKLVGGASATKKVTFDQPYGELPEAEAGDQAFAGWFTAAEGGNEVTATTVVSTAGDHALYAQYRSVEALLTPYVTDASGNRYDSGTELEKGTLLYLTSDSHGAAIYYTTKDSEKANIPEDDAHRYKGALSFDGVSSVYAKAVKENYKSSRIIGFTYKLKATAEDWGEVLPEDRKGYADADKIPTGIWASGYEDTDYTGSAITFDDTLHVYYGKTLLTPDSDYTVKYANNIKASNEKTKATITITGKGNYAGQRKITFDIKPLSLGDGTNKTNNIANVADVQAEYTGRKIQLATTVTFDLGGKEITLKKGTDFDYDYSEVGVGAADKETVYTIKVKGKGNYTGAAVYTETIYPKNSRTNIAKLTFAAIPAQIADGTEQTPKLTITDKITDKSNPYVLTTDDYDAVYFNNVAAGKATVVVTGKGQKYAGTKTITFTIKGNAIAKAKFAIGAVTYDGTAKTPSVTVTFQPSKNEAEEVLSEGVDYTVTVSNNVKKGNGTITFTGIGRFTGTVKKTFKINAQNFNGGLVTVTCADRSSSAVSDDLGSFTYTKNGVKPEVTLTFDGQELVLGRDYKVKYANNNAVAGAKTPTMTITGAGNFAGTFTRTFTIEKSSLENVTVTATDIAYSAKTGLCKPTIAVYDTNGVKLAAGKDYDNKKIEYTYVAATKIQRKQGKTTSEITVEPGSAVDLKADIIPAGTDIKVTLYGKGLYDEKSSNSAEFTFVNSLISKATVTLAKSSFDYTGSKIEISEADITVKIGKTEVPKGAYRITSITQNVSKGTAKLTITGVGKYDGQYYGGSKTVTFKINAKNIK